MIKPIMEDTEWQTNKEPANIHIRAQKNLGRTARASRVKEEKLELNRERNLEANHAANQVVVRNAPRTARAKAGLPG